LCDCEISQYMAWSIPVPAGSVIQRLHVRSSQYGVTLRLRPMQLDLSWHINQIMFSTECSYSHEIRREIKEAVEVGEMSAPPLP